ncbi:flagellar biosynthesis protein FlhA [Rheinheimera faecalis]|uniref:flagellar biosynthesis protein FlhA n=1 Tax=Rheinheimera faecalis TaxID=2901141 RepID=UPI001E5FEF36|nr:flagellar biosynthesis protein FlhA [Rheinheimera faecalis]
MLRVNLMKGKNELFLVTALMAIMLMLFVPIPAAVLDILLILNVSLALLILLLTFYSERPLSFSTFPSLLLIATLFRLGLNISATRLILNDGDAGVVISSIGSYVVGGNYVVGLVVFFILVVIQYVVVTNGAQRVAEVAARFTLDSMPGKQMSVDSDLNMGLIDETQAKTRRKDIEREANFYGAMDGATKFVKGDAIAGIIIILINIIGGLSIGVAQKGLDWGVAMEHYTLLTIGDGIVTQVPSLIIAVATGILITRAASDAKLGEEISKQAMSSPQTLVIVGLMLGCLVFVPSFPSFPIALMSLAFLALSWMSLKQKTATEADTVPKDQALDVQPEKDAYGLTHTAPIEILVSTEIEHFLKRNGNVFMERLSGFKANHFKKTGYLIADIRVTVEPLFKAYDYKIRIYGANVASGVLYVDRYLIIDPAGKFTAVKGIESKEPTYRLPACWVEESQLNAARQANYTVVDAETTLLTHVTEVVKGFTHELLTRAETESMLAVLAKRSASLVDELVPGVLSYSDVQKVLKHLLKERVPIHNLELILEVLVEQGRHSKDILTLTQHVRVRLKSQICAGLVDNEGNLNVITLSPKVERQIVAGLTKENDKASLALEPGLLDNLIGQLTRQTEQLLIKKMPPVLITHSSVRFAMNQLMERVIPQLSILSVDEIPSYTNVKAFATVSESPTLVAKGA